MQVSLDASELAPVIASAVKTALDTYATELKSLLVIASNNRLKTVPEAAQYLQVCEKSVRNYVDAGTLIATRLGGNIRFTQADLDAFVEAHRTGQPVTAE